jgi:hypothetical protein
MSALVSPSLTDRADGGQVLAAELSPDPPSILPVAVAAAIGRRAATSSR